MLLHFVQFGLWALYSLLQFFVAIQMMRRRLHREFPAFFVYTAVHVFRSVLLYVLYWRQFSSAYFIGYWLGETADIALGLAVIYELYSHVFRNYRALHRLTALLFRWATAILILVATISAASAPGADTDRMLAGLLILSRSGAVVKVGLLFLLFTFASYFHLTWRHYALGIAVGLGLFATVDLAALAIRAQTGSIAILTYALVRSVAYNCSVLIWIFYLFSGEHLPRVVDAPPRSDLVRWNEALMELVSR